MTETRNHNEPLDGVTLFCGYDPREAIGFHTFISSVLRRASRPVNFYPLSSLGMPTGSNDFTTSRFLAPYLMGFQGHAIYLDGSDMLCLDDIAVLDSMFNPQYAVQVVKHANYESMHDRKYVGTPMECQQSSYKRKNWASAMLINAEHPAWSGMTPAGIARHKTIDLLQFRFLEDFEIGDLPPEWNVLVDEGQDDTNAKVCHFTAGIPAFPHYRNARRSKDWFSELSDLKGE